MKYYIIAGEASGDLHGSNLIRNLRKTDPDADVRCWGGDLMKAEGADLVKHYRDLAFMGFVEVLAHLRTISGNLHFCRNDILSFNPDVVILIDYPGFNLRIARFAKNAGFRVVYYISPQIWAWNTSRVNIIKNSVDRVLTILPFEKQFYSGHGYDADFIGHPLLDVLRPERQFAEKSVFLKNNDLEEKPVIALLPGSRKQEVRNMLKIMISVKEDFPGYQFVVAVAPSLNDDFYHSVLQNSGIRTVRAQTYDLLHNSEAALVTSGTATLETALLNIPQVVCYKGNYFSYLFAKQLIKVKFISLVNLIMDRMVVTELIQNNLTRKNITSELKKILKDGFERSAILEGYLELRNKLGGEGASMKAAGIIFSEAKKTTEKHI